ncbi:hypothetical protein KIL84_018777 [Mauremys mutica]|uniref:Uncharacterized protein n=1 Tax=Mauremys mutica TaxID=74926 RepID=A0A9D4B9C9_9SAUR|nr:hypothetical protein KIL84_018777 [Mauremys mutica]
MLCFSVQCKHCVCICVFPHPWHNFLLQHLATEDFIIQPLELIAFFARICKSPRTIKIESLLAKCCLEDIQISYCLKIAFGKSLEPKQSLQVHYFSCPNKSQSPI